MLIFRGFSFSLYFLLCSRIFKFKLVGSMRKEYFHLEGIFSPFDLLNLFPLFYSMNRRLFEPLILIFIITMASSIYDGMLV